MLCVYTNEAEAMATLQAKTVNGKKYWQIVQSRRVNGKPRPIVLAHLGPVEGILAKLGKGAWPAGVPRAVKSYSHGLVCSLLELAARLGVVDSLNARTKAARPYFAAKPLRNNMTVGATLLLAAMGRVCHPASKRAWCGWAEGTSLPYLLRSDLSGLDSQHFWDMMDSFPADEVAGAELEILRRAGELFGMGGDTLLYDTTNFYTYIASDNTKAPLAQRGKNKQKRGDLRQVGLAMAVTQGDFMPVFHEAYRGNMNDAGVFNAVIGKLKDRMAALGMALNGHTIVFDRGCNSKKNLELVSGAGMFYVGALSPSHHKGLMADSAGNFEVISLDDEPLEVFRDNREIWGEKRTVLVFVSATLKAGQSTGLLSSAAKARTKLDAEDKRLQGARHKKFPEAELRARLAKMAAVNGAPGLVKWELKAEGNGRFRVEHGLDADVLSKIEESHGFRIIMTNRHDWSTKEIIKCYYGQAVVENAFKNIKNPYHLAVTPEFHWTDQKIKVHFFTCVLGYLLASIIWKIAREKCGYGGTLDNLLDLLNGVRLAALIEPKAGGGEKVDYCLERMNQEEQKLIEAFAIGETHLRPLKIPGFGVYES
jgi:transposase